MDADGFPQLTSNGKHRVQAGHGVLKNDGNLAAPEGGHLLGVIFQDILTLKEDLSLQLSGPCIKLQKTQIICCKVERILGDHRLFGQEVIFVQRISPEFFTLIRIIALDSMGIPVSKGVVI